jgi:hypothetical protein
MSWSICTSERFGDSFYVLRAWVSVSSLVNVGVKVAMGLEEILECQAWQAFD